MLRASNLIGFGVNPSFAPVSLINRGTMVTTISAVTTYTFSGYPIGTASPTRRVIAIVYASLGTTGRTLSSATIGGVSATIDVQATHNSGGSQTLAIISATVPTGTTANIVATFSGAMARAACWAVAVDGLQSVTPVLTASATAADPISGTVNQRDGGFVIAGAFTNNTSSYTWTGVTERVDTAFDVQTASGGDLFSIINSIGTSISADAASPGSRTAFVLANYR